MTAPWQIKSHASHIYNEDLHFLAVYFVILKIETTNLKHWSLPAEEKINKLKTIKYIVFQNTGSMLAWWLALSSHSLNSCFNSWKEPFWVKFACSSCVCIGGPIRAYPSCHCKERKNILNRSGASQGHIREDETTSRTWSHTMYSLETPINNHLEQRNYI